MLVADDTANGHAQCPRNGTQGVQARIGAGVVLKRPNRVRGNAHAPGEVLLAHSSFDTEASDGSTLACALLSRDQLALLHGTVCKNAEAIAVMRITGCGDEFSFLSE